MTFCCTWTMQEGKCKRRKRLHIRRYKQSFSFADLERSHVATKNIFLRVMHTPESSCFTFNGQPLQLYAQHDNCLLATSNSLKEAQKLYTVKKVKMLKNVAVKQGMMACYNKIYLCRTHSALFCTRCKWSDSHQGHSKSSQKHFY